MVWFRVDDTFYGHPKAAGISNDSLATWTRAGNWSGWQLTDGAVPRDMLRTLAGGAADPEGVARDLVDRRLWEPGDGGWQFHDWADYNPTREQVLAKRKKDAARRADWLARARAARHDVTHSVSNDVSHGVINEGGGEAPGEAQQPDHGVSHSVSHGVSHTSPDPTRPDPTRKVGRVGGGEDAHARTDDGQPDDDDELTQVQALMAAAGKPVDREDAATIRTTVLAKGGDVRNRRAYIGKVLGDPKQARAFAPGAGHTPTVAEIVADTRRPGGPSADEPARAAEARQMLANRPRPAGATATAPPAAQLFGEDLARAQLAEARANRLPELPPADNPAEETDTDDVPY